MREDLEKLLRSMFDEHDFLLGMKTYLPTEENQKEMLAAIKNGWVNNAEEAVEYAASIYYDEPFEDEEPEAQNG